jgi:hypothetical protein
MFSLLKMFYVTAELWKAWDIIKLWIRRYKLA